MPRATYTVEFLVGYVVGRMELRNLVHRLETEQVFSQDDIDKILLEIVEIEEQVCGQARLVQDDRIKPKMIEFSKLFNMASEAWEKRKNALGTIEAVGSPSIPSGGVEPTLIIEPEPSCPQAEALPRPIDPIDVMSHCRSSCCQRQCCRAHSSQSNFQIQSRV